MAKKKSSKTYCQFCHCETYPDETPNCCQDCKGELQIIKHNRSQIDRQDNTNQLSRTELLGMGFISDSEGE